MGEAAYELPIDDVAAHVTQLRQAADHGDPVYLTDHGRRFAVVLPYAPTAKSLPGHRPLDEVLGTLPGFENDVDVDASRDEWSAR